jgi:hypothetical protein
MTRAPIAAAARKMRLNMVDLLSSSQQLTAAAQRESQRRRLPNYIRVAVG